MCDNGDRRQASENIKLTDKAHREVGAWEMGDHWEDGAVAGEIGGCKKRMGHMMGPS